MGASTAALPESRDVARRAVKAGADLERAESSEKSRGFGAAE